MRVRGVVHVDLSAHVDRTGCLEDTALFGPIGQAVDIEAGSIVVVDIGEARYWSQRLMHFLADALQSADTVQITGSKPQGVRQAVAEFSAVAVQP